MAAPISVMGLIAQYRKHHPRDYFFDDATLEWFGEYISEMKVLKHTHLVDGRECYVLSTFQHKNPLGPKRQHYYFAVDTFEYMGARKRM